MDPKNTSGTKRRDLLELGIGYALILIVIWTARPWQRVFYSLAAAYLIFVLWLSFDGWQRMGMRVANLGRSLWVPGVALAMAAIAISIARRMHTLHPFGGGSAFVKRYWGYALWAFAQQVLLQDFFLRRMRRLAATPVRAALIAAAVFSLAHLPNPILTITTFAWGFSACCLFLRYRNLYSLGMAHAILGITIAITLPASLIRNMRVGLGYLNYHARLHAADLPR